MARTTVKGKVGQPDTLIGGAEGSDFEFTNDFTYAAGRHLVVGGDPGQPGPMDRFSTQGYSGSLDTFTGHAGVHDVLRMGNGKKVLFLGSEVANARALISIEEIVLGSGGQMVDLTSLSRTYGSVRIRGGSGDDLLATNAGNDTIFGHDGRDYIWGGSGKDELRGGADTDFIRGGSGNDSLRGDAGSDTVYGGSGNDTVLGGEGADFLSGGAGNDVIKGGDDSVSIGTTEPDRLFGEEGNDQLWATHRSAELWGGDGADTLLGGRSASTFVGGAGNDVYNAGLHGTSGNKFGLDVTGGTDQIIGFSELNGDKLFLTNWQAESIGMTGYSQGATPFGSDIVTNIAAGDVTATTATAAHSQFVFVQATGELWFDADGSGAGAATKIAVLDLNQTTASAAGISGTALEASDFLLVSE